MEGKQPEQDAGEPLLLTHEQAIRKLNISRTMFYELLRTGKLTNIPMSRQVRRIALSECEAYAASLLAEARGDAA